MKPIVIESKINVDTEIPFETVLTEEVYNALIKKYNVEPDDEHYTELPTFDDYYNCVLNPKSMYKEWPYMPYVKWRHWRDSHYVSGGYDYYSGDPYDGYTAESGTYVRSSGFTSAIRDMLDREWQLYCIRNGYKDKDVLEYGSNHQYDFQKDEECVVPFERKRTLDTAHIGNVDVDIPSKKKVEYYE